MTKKYKTTRHLRAAERTTAALPNKVGSSKAVKISNNQTLKTNLGATTKPELTFFSKFSVMPQDQMKVFNKQFRVWLVKFSKPTLTSRVMLFKFLLKLGFTIILFGIIVGLIRFPLTVEQWIINLLSQATSQLPMDQLPPKLPNPTLWALWDDVVKAWLEFKIHCAHIMASLGSSFLDNAEELVMHCEWVGTLMYEYYQEVYDSAATAISSWADFWSQIIAQWTKTIICWSEASKKAIVEGWKNTPTLSFILTIFCLAVPKTRLWLYKRWLALIRWIKWGFRRLRLNRGPVPPVPPGGFEDFDDPGDAGGAGDVADHGDAAEVVPVNADQSELELNPGDQNAPGLIQAVYEAPQLPQPQEVLVPGGFQAETAILEVVIAPGLIPMPVPVALIPGLPPMPMPVALPQEFQEQFPGFAFSNVVLVLNAVVLKIPLANLGVLGIQATCDILLIILALNSNSPDLIQLLNERQFNPQTLEFFNDVETLYRQIDQPDVHHEFLEPLAGETVNVRVYLE